MRKLLFIVSTFVSVHASTQIKQINFPPHSAALIYQVPDTLKAVQYYNEFMIDSASICKSSLYGSYFSEGIIGMEADSRGNRSIVFKLNNTGNDAAKLLSTGLNVTRKGNLSVAWKYAWRTQETYRVLLSIIADSASQSTYYTGYVFLPQERSWKLLASFQKMNDGNYIKQPSVFFSSKKGHKMRMVQKVLPSYAWVQRENGSWKALDEARFYSREVFAGLQKTAGKSLSLEANKNIGTLAENGRVVIVDNNGARPTIDLTRHIDSLEQLSIDLEEMNAAVQSGRIDTTGSKENVYYKILKEGTGDFVNVTDTVTAFYKGSLLKDGSVFDSTKEKPATFPLKRLIKGWQVGVPLIKVGGKIRLYIPSSLAYSIRSRSKDIPPNSVLVFDVEVVSVKR